ncbi:MAG TPA: tRNA (cytidine(34)-2'-O)-methyltransferase [Usitatibacteraceae bacterium]|nr:tRNA (cytidine(34)-2'-O)-methyltransferase [Usitatibacteraceae bacterium]
MFHVVLVRPEIPPNTGNVIRLCANAGAQLHLVHPLGFEWDDARVRRAGLDYHELATIRHHSTWDACLEALRGSRLFAVETRQAARYDANAYQPGDAFVFGPETSGLGPAELRAIPEAHRIVLPMRSGNRSLNLSNAVAVMVFEAWRQNGFAGGEWSGLGGG